MGARKDLTGKKYNRLIAIGVNEEVSKEKGYVFWDFKCDCGSIKAIKGTKVTSGKTKSCGCLNQELRVKRATKAPGEGALNSFLYEYKYNAKRRNIEWNLTKSEFKKITSENCYYCGSSPEPYKTIKNTTYVLVNGIDRVNSNGKYSIENTVSCCNKCNLMKNKWSEKDFLDHIEKVYKYGVCKGHISE